LAWYRQGQVCILRKTVKHEIQEQNLFIKDMNQVIHTLWNELSASVKSELQKYAILYKKRYPSLRKRGNNAYSIFLMICHGLIRKFQLNSLSKIVLTSHLRVILSKMSIHLLVMQGVIKAVKYAYQLKGMLIKDHQSQDTPYHLKSIIISYPDQPHPYFSDVIHHKRAISGRDP
jgi:hypothetical protein